MWQVKPGVWLKSETDKVEATILLPKYYGLVFSAASLASVLADVGLVYTVAQMEAIIAELVTREIVESV